jgi:hypothetical protein
LAAKPKHVLLGREQCNGNDSAERTANDTLYGTLLFGRFHVNAPLSLEARYADALLNQCRLHIDWWWPATACVVVGEGERTVQRWRVARASGRVVSGRRVANSSRWLDR